MIRPNQRIFNLSKRTIYILSFIFLSGLPIICSAKLHDYETTRLKSTGGTGVGSILLDESPILNPAPVVFFNQTSIYLQKFGQKYIAQNNDPEQQELANNYSKSSDSYGVVLAEAGNTVKGALSYQKQKEAGDQRQRFSLSIGSVLSEKTGAGIIIHKTMDESSQNNDQNFNKNKKKRDYYQTNLGITHAIDEKLTLGVIANDVFKAKTETTNLILGIQYLAFETIALMFDGGFNYRQEFSDTLIYRGAIQLNIFSDFFLRSGIFYDLGIREKGNGLGLAWVTPGLVLEGALKNSRAFKPNQASNNDPSSSYKTRELSFSLSYRF